MMPKRFFHVVTALLVIAGMLGAAVPAWALTATRHVKGRVIAINRRTHVMTVKSSTGGKLKLKYSSQTTRLWQNGTRITLGKLHVGNRVNAAYTPSPKSGTPGTATDVDDDNGLFQVKGVVAAVDTTAGTVSIASDLGGSTVVLKVDSGTVIMRNGASATLADLLFGDRVEAKYDSATMLASSIIVEDSLESSEVEGTITAIDATAGTITISGEGDSAGSESFSAVDVTLNVSGAVVMLDESPAPLSSLQVGMQAEAQYDPATMNASFIEAESQSGDSSPSGG